MQVIVQTQPAASTRIMLDLGVVVLPEHPTSTTKTQLSQPQHGWDQLPRALWGQCLTVGSQKTFKEDAVSWWTVSGMSRTPPVSARLWTHVCQDRAALALPGAGAGLLPEWRRGASQAR